MTDDALTEDDEALYLEGRRRMETGDLEGAVEAFSASSQRSPHFKTLELLGECLYRLGRYRESIVPLAAATTLNRQVRAPALLAEALLKLGWRSDAREIALLALSRHSENRSARRIAEETSDLAEDYDRPAGA